jgi:futalosine hydrolase
MNPDLLIVCATAFEISGFLTACPAKKKTVTQTGCPLLSGSDHGRTWDLLITGPGVFNAIHALTQYLEKFTPKFILHTGIGGIFKETGLKIGDLAIATQEQYVHCGVQAEGLENDPLPFDLIPQETLTRVGIYSFDAARVDHCLNTLCAKGAMETRCMVKGAFITVSRITATFEMASRLHGVFSPVMEAMEGAACAHVAKLYNLPLLEIRAGANFVGERDKSRWDMDLAAHGVGVVSVAFLSLCKN